MKKIKEENIQELLDLCRIIIAKWIDYINVNPIKELDVLLHRLFLLIENIEMSKSKKRRLNTMIKIKKNNRKRIGKKK